MSEKGKLKVSKGDVEDARAHVPNGGSMAYEHLFTALAITSDHTIDEVAGALTIQVQQVRSYLRRKDVSEVIRVLTRRDVQANGVPLALKTLNEIVRDETATGASRARAASTLLQWAGEMDTNKRVDEIDGKPLEEMSLAELEKTAADLSRRAKAELAARTGPIGNA